MGASRYIGRVGALAVGLGAGAALLTAGAAVAWADDDAAEQGSAVSGAVSRGPAAGASSGRARASAAVERVGGSRLRVADRLSGSAPRSAAVVRMPAPAPRSAGAAVAQVLSTVAAPAVLSSVGVTQSSVMNPNAMPARPSALAIVAAGFLSTAGLSKSVLGQLQVAFYRGPTAPLVNQSLALNGYDLVPASAETVTSFYGRWAFLPGGTSYFQGQQQYGVVDPATGQTVGRFEALVASGNPLTLRDRYVELLVTGNDGVNVGTAPGQVPPVGSIISTERLFGRFGWSYSAMPSPDGDVLSLKILTPFGDIPLPVSFDAAKGIADHTLDNRPINLGNGYSIAPADPAGETLVGISGLLPLFTTVQGRQTFNLYDSEGNAIGSFEGVYTPTSDIFGTYTEAVLVTSSDDPNVGTNPGQVPPPGSVFNVIYLGGDDTYVLYSSLPSRSGDVVSVIASVGGKISNIATWPLTALNASAPPPVRRLTTSGGYSLLPISPLVLSGVNGLPPREVQNQGYQQFGVYDSAGVQQGSFDAMVFNQWDMLGTSSTAILVTGVTDGTAGTDPGDVPPVGSMFEYDFLGNTGFGFYYAVMPSPSGDVIRFRILTPLLDIPLRSRYNAVSGLEGASLFDPFV